MKLFNDFEAVKFPEENMILITRGKYIYYVYDLNSKIWNKYKHSENYFIDSITVSNYPDVSREEIINALGGKFPNKEADFIRLCDLSQLHEINMLALLKEDYQVYMSDRLIYNSAYIFLSESTIKHKSYLALRKLFDECLTLNKDKEYIIAQIKALSLAIIGRDIFKREIQIVDGHDSSSYFWIMPVRVIDYSDTNDLDNVAEMDHVEISIEENDVNQYLTPFLYKYFDDELKANKSRGDYSGFEWYLTHNFYTYDSVRKILNDIQDTINALSQGRENEFIAKMPCEDNTPAEIIIDFYNRFIYRMEYMIKIGSEKGYNLISFMGP
ncbi:MAG: hypothetical protein IJS99_05795 [Synergistaceae bacterium]|nr:hypothetical protein [Synergistaceae bacterium]